MGPKHDSSGLIGGHYYSALVQDLFPWIASCNLPVLEKSDMPSKEIDLGPKHDSSGLIGSHYYIAWVQDIFPWIASCNLPGLDNLQCAIQGNRFGTQAR